MPEEEVVDDDSFPGLELGYRFSESLELVVVSFVVRFISKAVSLMDSDTYSLALTNAGSIKGSRVISATESARSFSEVLDRVGYRGETFARACLLGWGRGYDKASGAVPEVGMGTLIDSSVLIACERDRLDLEASFRKFLV